MQDMQTFLTLESALNARFRGHSDRDWTQWQEVHAYQDAHDIPADSRNAWIGRQKHNYRGIGTLKALRHLVGGNVDQPFLAEIGELEDLERLNSNGRWWQAI